MRRIWLSVPAILMMIGGWAHAGVLCSDENVYGAEIDLLLSSEVAISNGVSFFSQSDTPRGLALFGTYLFSIPADEPGMDPIVTDVGTTLNGPWPFGVYKCFSSQHQSFLGTYLGEGLAPTTGLIAVLAEGVGIGKTFTEVFGDLYTEQQVIDALIAVGLGDSSGFDVLFPFIANSLHLQPAYLESESDRYLLGPAELVKFSGGVSAGVVQPDSSYRLTGTGPFSPTAAVPEPGSLTLCILGVVGLLRMRSRMPFSAR